LPFVAVKYFKGIALAFIKLGEKILRLFYRVSSGEEYKIF